ncbi:MAG: ParB N-terminal domain-containing protein [Planctomycetaceae bacterium]
MTTPQVPIRDRVRELRRVRGADLVPHPRNWRTHPEPQRQALRGVLAEIGYADALLARELADGRLQLIDGHLRAEATPDALVPVLVLDVTDAEAEQLLLTLDPLAGLAGTDTAMLDELLGSVQFQHAEILAALRETFSTGLPEGVDGASSPLGAGGNFPAEAGEAPHEAPRDEAGGAPPDEGGNGGGMMGGGGAGGEGNGERMGSERAGASGAGGAPADARYCVLVQCDDEEEQLELLERLQGEGHTCRALIA